MSRVDLVSSWCQSKLPNSCSHTGTNHHLYCDSAYDGNQVPEVSTTSTFKVFWYLGRIYTLNVMLRENEEVVYVVFVTPTVGLRLLKSSFLFLVIFWPSSVTHQDNYNVFFLIWRLPVVSAAIIYSSCPLSLIQVNQGFNSEAEAFVSIYTRRGHFLRSVCICFVLKLSWAFWPFCPWLLSWSSVKAYFLQDCPGLIGWSWCWRLLLGHSGNCAF